MTSNHSIARELITEDDAFLAEALEVASVPTLIMSIVHMTGDTAILRGAIKPKVPLLGEIQGYLSKEEQAAIRVLALETLKKFRDNDCQLPPPPSAQTIREMMNFFVGETVPEEYVPMMLEEMGLDGKDSRSVQLTAVPQADRENFHVLIIGAGMTGLLAALRLQEMGVRYTVIEKNPEVGGTWYENSYPGARVDIGSHFYSYSFEPNHEWTQYYAARDELFSYFKRFSDKHDLRKNIQFGTEVKAATYDQAGSSWQVEVVRKDGSKEMLNANAMISAVGQLNRPSIPQIAGQDKYKGATVHSAQWRSPGSLKGKRIAVIGTGASAFQLVPEIAKEADALFVFQRSPVWMLPNPNYHGMVSEHTKWMLKHIPFYARWYRFLLFWPGTDGVLPALKMDPDWPQQHRSINQHNETWRQSLEAYMKVQVGDDHALLEKVTPKYPVMVKRMLQDNGSWLQTLKQPHVSLVTDPIVAFDETGIVCADQHYDVDLIVYATGFNATKFLWPMEITGLGGVKLQEFWGDEPGAYLGITVPGFPNFFCMYGPGTNLAHGGSIIFNSECQVRYAVECVKMLLENRKRAMDCRPDVYARFNDKLADTLKDMVWSYKGASSWYKNKSGRVVTTSPWRLVDYWKWTRNPNPADYEVW